MGREQNVKMVSSAKQSTSPGTGQVTGTQAATLLSRAPGLSRPTLPIGPAGQGEAGEAEHVLMA